jgi:Sec-independent protein translocase protein TatA
MKMMNGISELIILLVIVVIVLAGYGLRRKT